MQKSVGELRKENPLTIDEAPKYFGIRDNDSKVALRQTIFRWGLKSAKRLRKTAHWKEIKTFADSRKILARPPTKSNKAKRLKRCEIKTDWLGARLNTNVPIILFRSTNAIYIK